jgi:xanthine dehydrogenase YagT iron-sulfur-binding subunit
VVREWMSGNICRCSAYPQITAAVLAAAQETQAVQETQVARR